MQIRVTQRFHHVRRTAVVGVHLRRGAARGVIAERDKIDGVFQDLIIARCFVDGYPFFAEYAGRVSRIRAPRLHIDKKQVFPIFLQRRPDIFRLAAVRVEVTARQHTTHLILRVNLMGDFGG